jgi:hypothetical protein
MPFAAIAAPSELASLPGRIFYGEPLHTSPENAPRGFATIALPDRCLDGKAGEPYDHTYLVVI